MNESVTPRTRTLEEVVGLLYQAVSRIEKAVFGERPQAVNKLSTPSTSKFVSAIRGIDENTERLNEVANELEKV